jgi:deazaflavin-dependent oxidoreductase (nitroreductase family)
MSFSSRLTNILASYFPEAARAAGSRQVAKYRSSNGRKGDKILGYPCFLLDVVGRKTGQSHPVMLIHVPRGDDLIVVGSAAGLPTTPNWYKNLMAAGGGHAQVGADRWQVQARELSEGGERDECWALAVTRFPGFAAYQTYTERRIPVALLKRRDPRS